MSGLEQAIYDALADPMVDMISIVRSPNHGWQANIKRAYRGWNVHHDKDPVKALQAALAAPPLAPMMPKAAEPAAAPASAVDEDLFG